MRTSMITRIGWSSSRRRRWVGSGLTVSRNDEILKLRDPTVEPWDNRIQRRPCCLYLHLVLSLPLFRNFQSLCWIGKSQFFGFQFVDTVLAGKCVTKSLKLLPTRYAKGPSLQAQFSSPPQFENPTWATKNLKIWSCFCTSIFFYLCGIYFFVFFVKFM